MNMDGKAGTFGELLCDRQGKVCRCIIGYDEFGRQVLLTRQTIELLANKSLTVVGGHRHRYRYGTHTFAPAVTFVPTGFRNYRWRLFELSATFIVVVLRTHLAKRDRARGNSKTSR